MKKLFALMTILALFSFGFYNCGEEPDACETLICLNGGECIDGACDCPEKYTGERCENQVTPRLIKIDKIDVTKRPLYTKSGSNWDPNDGADLSCEILYEGTATVYRYHKTIANVDPGTTKYTFHPLPKPEIEADKLGGSFTIELLDVDDLGDDLMGSVDFKLYDSKGGWPETIEVGDNSTDVAFILHLTYIFN